MEPLVPSWPLFRDSDKYKELDKDQRLEVFDRWRYAKERDLAENMGASPNTFLRFYAVSDANRIDIEQGKEFEPDADEFALNMQDHYAQTSRDKAQVARWTLKTDRALRRHIAGNDPDENGRYQLSTPEGILPVRVDETQKEWVTQNGYDNPATPFQWETRVFERPIEIKKDTPRSPEERHREDSLVRKGFDREFQVNPALALLGFDKYKEAVMGSEGTTREKTEALAYFNTYYNAALNDLLEYANSKKVTSDAVMFAPSKAYVDPQRIADAYKSRRIAADDEDGELPVTTKMFLTPGRVAKLNKDINSVSNKDLGEEIAAFYLKKRGMGAVSESIPRNPELAENLGQMFKDALLDDERMWDKKTLTKKDSRGNVIYNPSRILIDDPDSVEAAVKKAGASQAKAEAYKFAAEYVQEENSSRIVDSMLSGVRELDQMGAGLTVSETAQRIQMVDFRLFYELNRDKDWSDKELLDEYEKFTRDPGVLGTLRRMSLNKSPIGMIGTLMQTWNSAEKPDNWVGGTFESVGTFLRSFEQSAPQGMAKFGIGLYGMTSGLPGGGLPGADTAREANQALKEALTTSDTFWGADARWGRMIGEEAGFIASTMGSGYAARPMRMAMRKKLSSATLYNETSAKIGELISRAPGFAGKKLPAGMSPGEYVSHKMGAKTYFGVQASRSSEAAFGESFDRYYDEAIAQGFSAEEAKKRASNQASVTALGAGLITGAMMKLIPGGTERLFERGSRMTPKQMSETLGITKESFTKAMGTKAFKKEAETLLRDDFGLFSRAGATSVAGGMGREAAEEFFDEFLQGILAGMTYDPDRPMGDIVKGALEGALVGAVMGGSTTAMDPQRRNISLDKSQLESLSRMRDMADKIEASSPRTAAQMRQNAEQIEQNLTEEQRANLDPNDALNRGRDGDTIFFVTEDGQYRKGIMQDGLVYSDKTDFSELESDTGVDDSIPQDVFSPNQIRYAAFSEKELGVEGVAKATTTKFTEYSQELDRLRKNEEGLDVSEQARMMDAVYKRAQKDEDLVDTDSLILFETAFGPIVESYAGKAARESGNPVAELEARIIEFEQDETETDRQIIDGSISEGQASSAKLRTRAGIHKTLDRMFQSNSDIASLLKEAVDVSFAAIHAARKAETAARTEEEVSMSEKISAGDSSKIISKFLDELATEVKNYDAARDEGKTPEEMGQARREIKARVATLIAGNKASSLYKKARTRLNKASSDEMTPIMAGVLGSEDAPTGDVTIDRVRRHFSQAEEYAPFKIPTVNTGNTKLKDTKKVKYLHNNLVQEPSREGAISEGAEGEAISEGAEGEAISEGAESGAVRTEQDQREAVELANLFDIIHRNDKGEIVADKPVEQEQFLAQASGLTNNLALALEIYNRKVIELTEPEVSALMGNLPTSPIQVEDSETDTTETDTTETDTTETGESVQGSSESSFEEVAEEESEATPKILPMEELILIAEEEQSRLIDADKGKVGRPNFETFVDGVKGDSPSDETPLANYFEAFKEAKTRALSKVSNALNGLLQRGQVTGKDLENAEKLSESISEAMSPEAQQADVDDYIDVVGRRAQEFDTEDSDPVSEDTSDTSDTSDTEETSFGDDVSSTETAVNSGEPSPLKPDTKEVNGETQEVDPKNKGKKTKAKPEPTNKYVGEELDTLDKKLREGQEKESSGIYVTQGEFNKPGMPARVGRLTKDENGVKRSINAELLEKYPQVAPEESATLARTPYSIRNRAPDASTDLQGNSPVDVQENIATRYAIIKEGFSNNPLHVAATLSAKDAKPIPLPDFFLQNKDKINPALILDKDGTHVIGAKTHFKDSKGKHEVVQIDEAGVVNKTLEEIAHPFKDKEQSERSKKAATRQSQRGKGKELLPLLLESTPEGVSPEELSWTSSERSEDLAAAVIRALNSYDRDEGGERKIPEGSYNEALLNIIQHATLSVLKTRAAREVDPRDAAALDAWFETNYLRRTSGIEERNAVPFIKALEMSYEGKLSNMFDPEYVKAKKGVKGASLYHRIIDPEVTLPEGTYAGTEANVYWDSVGNLIGSVVADQRRKDKAKKNARTAKRMEPGQIEIPESNMTAEQLSRAMSQQPSSDAEMYISQNEVDEFGNPISVDDVTDADADATQNSDLENYQRDNNGGYDVDEDGQYILDSLPERNTPLSDEEKAFRAKIKKESDALGLDPEKPESLKGALQKIASNRKYPKHYREVAKLLLRAGNLSFDQINFIMQANEGRAGFYRAGESGRQDTVMISTAVTNPRGVHDVVVHELLHATLDQIVGNPQTKEQEDFVAALDLYRERSLQTLELLEDSKEGAIAHAKFIALREASNYSLAKIKRMLEESDSVLTASMKPDMTEEQLRRLFIEVREEKFGAYRMQNELLQTRYAHGINPDGTIHSNISARKEFVAHLLTDEHFQFYLQNVDNESRGGSLFRKIARGIWWGLSGQPASNANVAAMEGLMTLAEDSKTLDPRLSNTIADFIGASPAQQAATKEFREETPAFQGSLSAAGQKYLQKAAIKLDVTKKSMGLPRRSFTDGFGGWITPSGYLIPLRGNQEHWEVAQKLGYASSYEAMKNGYFRVVIDDMGAFYSGNTSKAVPRKIKKDLDDWAIFNDQFVEFDPDEFYDDGLHDLQGSLPQENSFERRYWKDSKSIMREAAPLMGVRMFPTSNPDIKEIQLLGDGTIGIPEGAKDRDVNEAIFKASLTAAFTPRARAQADKQMREAQGVEDENARIIASAGNIDNLFAAIINEQITGESSMDDSSDVDLGEVSQQILSGEFGPITAGILQKTLDAAHVATRNEGRSFNTEMFRSSGTYVGDRVSDAQAARTLKLTKASPEEMAYFRKMASMENIPVAEWVQKTFPEDSSYAEEVQMSLGFQREEFLRMANTEKEDGVAAHVMAQKATYNGAVQGSLVDKFITRKDPAKAGKFTPDVRSVDEVLDGLEISTNRLTRLFPELRKKGVNMDRMAQMFSVEGRLGKNVHEQLLELRGRITMTRNKARDHEVLVRKLMEESSDIGTNQIETLLDSPDKNLRSIAEDINTILGSTNDEAVIDEVDDLIRRQSGLGPRRPGEKTRRQKLIDDKEKALSTIRSRFGKEYARATRLEKRGQPGDKKKAMEIRSDAKSKSTADARVIVDAFYADMTNLYTQASGLFKQKQQAAELRIQGLDKGQELFTAIKDMRETINDLQDTVMSSSLFDNLGESKEMIRNLKLKVGSSQGIYLSRSYQGLDEPAWGDYIESVDPDANRRLNQAYAYFRNQFLDRSAQKLLKHPKVNNLTQARALAESGNMSPDPDKSLNQLVEEKTMEFLGSFASARAPGLSPGMLNVKVLSPRNEDLAPELRDLMGEYRDNIFNASQTIVRLGGMMANNDFLMGIKEHLEDLQKEANAAGRKIDFISDKPKKGLVPFATEATSRTGGTEALGPLAGMYAPPTFVQGFHDLQPEMRGRLHQLVMNYAAFTMGNMTTRRLRTHMRNFIGNPMFLVNAGMFIEAPARIAPFFLGMGPAAAMLGPGGDVFRNTLKGMSGGRRILKGLDKVGLKGEENAWAAETLSLMSEYAEVSLTGNDVHVNQMQEIRRSLESAGIAEPVMGYFSGGRTSGEWTRWSKNLVKGADSAATEIYQMGDDWWKVVAYENQLLKLAKAFNVASGKPTPKALREQLGTVDKNGVYSGPMMVEQAQKILDEIGLGTVIGNDSAAFQALGTPRMKQLAKQDVRSAAVMALKRAASHRVRKTMPNYSATIEFVRWLKKNGATAAVAPFISFRAEVARIMVETPVLAAREIATGIRTKNKGMTRMGAERGLGVLFTSTYGATAVANLAKLLYTVGSTLLGEDEEDKLPDRGVADNGIFSREQHIKRFISKYFRDGKVAVLNYDPSSGKVTWMDVSYMLPHATVTDPFRNIVESITDPTQSTWTNIQKSAGQLMAPYFAPQLWTSAIAKAQAEQDSVLSEIDPDPAWTPLREIGKSLAGISIPGTAQDAWKLLQAASKGGSYYKHGREVSVGQELLSNLLGTKIITTDVDSRFERNLTKWNFARQEAVQEFKSMIKSETSFSRRELQRALEKAIEMDKIVVSNAYRDYLAIKDLSPSRANKLLSSSNIPKDFKGMVALGVYKPWSPTSGDLKRAAEIEVKINNPGRTALLLNYIREKGERASYLYPDLVEEMEDLDPEKYGE